MHNVCSNKDGGAEGWLMRKKKRKLWRRLFPSLEDSFRLYKQGMELLKYCNDKLDTVEKKMLQMNEDGSLGEFSR